MILLASGSACIRSGSSEAPATESEDSIQVQCITRLSQPPAPLQTDDSTRVFVDNPLLTVAEPHVAATGAKGLIFRNLPGDTSSAVVVGATIGVVFQAGDDFVLPVSPPKGGSFLSAPPLVVVRGDGSLDAAWSEVYVNGQDSVGAVRSAHWTASGWSGHSSLLKNVDRDVLTATKTSELAKAGDDWWSYLAYTVRRQGMASILRFSGDTWSIEPAGSPFLAEPAGASNEHGAGLLIALTGRAPFGNTVVSWPLNRENTRLDAEYRVSDTLTQTVQKPRVFASQKGHFHAIWPAGRDLAEDMFYSAASSDVGRVWRASTSVQTGGAIAAWDGKIDNDGRIHVVANIESQKHAGTFETVYLSFDSENAEWTVVWRSSGSPGSIGKPAIAVLQDGPVLILFNTASRSPKGDFRTMKAEFNIECGTK